MLRRDHLFCVIVSNVCQKWDISMIEWFIFVSRFVASVKYLNWNYVLLFVMFYNIAGVYRKQ